MGHAFIWVFFFKSLFYSPVVLHSYFVIVLIVSPCPFLTDPVLTGYNYDCALFYWWLCLRSNVRYSNLRKREKNAVNFIIIIFFNIFLLFDEVEICLPASKFCSLWQIYELKVRSWVTKPNTWSARWLQVFVTQFQNLNWCVYGFKAC